MSSAAEEWRLLRTKADETTDDPDYVATNDPEAGSIDFIDIDGTMPSGAGYSGRSYTGMEFFLIGVTSARAISDHAGMTVDLRLTEWVDRTNAMLGGAAGLEPAIVQTAAVTAAELHSKVYFPFNGGRYTLRITSDTADSADNLEVWVRAVSR